MLKLHILDLQLMVIAIALSALFKDPLFFVLKFELVLSWRKKNSCEIGLCGLVKFELMRLLPVIPASK